MLRVAGPLTLEKYQKKASMLNFFSELTKVGIRGLLLRTCWGVVFPLFPTVAGVNASHAEEDSNWTKDMITSRLACN